MDSCPSQRMTLNDIDLSLLFLDSNLMFPVRPSTCAPLSCRHFCALSRIAATLRLTILVRLSAVISCLIRLSRPLGLQEVWCKPFLSSIPTGRSPMGWSLENEGATPGLLQFRLTSWGTALEAFAWQLAFCGQEHHPETTTALIWHPWPEFLICIRKYQTKMSHSQMKPKVTGNRLISHLITGLETPNNLERTAY